MRQPPKGWLCQAQGEKIIYFGTSILAKAVYKGKLRILSHK